MTLTDFLVAHEGHGATPAHTHLEGISIDGRPAGAGIPVDIGAIVLLTAACLIAGIALWRRRAQ